MSPRRRVPLVAVAVLLLGGGRAAWAGTAAEALATGRSHLAQGELVQARDALEAAVAADADDAAAHLELARCYLALHRLELAAAQAALALQSPSPPVQDATAVLIAALVPTTGADLAEETLTGTLAPEHRVAARAALAQAYAAAERHRDALVLYDRLLAESPEDGLAASWQLSVADIARRRGRREDEIAALEALARRYGPDSTWARAHPAASEALQPRRDALEREAVQRLGQDVLLMPPGAESTAAAGQVAALYAGWLGRNPDDPAAPGLAYDYATTLLRLGRFPEAAAQFEVCWQLAPEGPQASDSLAGVAEVALRLQQTSDEPGRRWLKTLLWAADTHHERFGDASDDARLQLLAAEGLLLAGQEADALARLEAVVARWPASAAGGTAARRVLDVYIEQRDWKAARTAAARFAAQSELTDPAARARIAEVLQQTTDAAD